MITVVVLKFPLFAVVEFEAKGHFGDEMIRVTGDSDGITFLLNISAGTVWKRYRIKTDGLLSNLRIWYLGRSERASAPGVFYIRDGVVKLYKINVLGHVVSRHDILNISSTYQGFNGKVLFEKESSNMGTVRGGITGWKGFYELYTNFN